MVLGRVVVGAASAGVFFGDDSFFGEDLVDAEAGSAFRDVGVAAAAAVPSSATRPSDDCLTLVFLPKGVLLAAGSSGEPVFVAPFSFVTAVSTFFPSSMPTFCGGLVFSLFDAHCAG